MARFTNQVALISGGADGLGKGIAALIASEGGKVVLLDSNQFKLGQTESEFKSAGYEVMTIVADVTSEQSIISAYAEVGKNMAKYTSWSIVRVLWVRLAPKSRIIPRKILIDCIR